ncbi:MAG: DUF167 domain-containing protein [Alphaproteobacteria bacterium]|nr:DUF167 domain-containing protein [Alphaproteobacteria bacterium]MBL6939052.1 DUF167 domain-containing protein [Alphaproteobacteria bacterium]MBL7099644.1 DUF167 domain-containing protein [Alphaproteobacteria bacterium]
MARLRNRGDGLSFQVRLTPRGGRDAVEGWIAGSDLLKARVAAIPEDGKANAALIALLAKTLGVAKSTIRIANGETARVKTILIEPAAPSLGARLEAIGECG